MRKEDAVQIFKAATEAVQPAVIMRRHLGVHDDTLVIENHSIPRHSFRHLYIIGAGKAAAAMALAVEDILGANITAGLVTTKYGHSLPTNKIVIREAAHPVPDESCVAGVAEMLRLLENTTNDDIVICLISGGASALWCDVPAGLTLAEVQTTFDQLIRSGADIHEVNTVRKHLSGIKGGQLIRHTHGARVFSFIISDVPGDDLSVIASGPTVPDATTFQDASNILAKYHLLATLPKSVRTHIEKGIAGAIADALKPGDPLFSNTINSLIGTNQVALHAAEQQAKELGYHTYIVPQLITGDAEEAARAFVALAREYKGQKPACILQGGETTVKVTGHGKGGRNQHFALVALHELSKVAVSGNIVILSGGTDGTDGPTDAAGAVVSADTLALTTAKQLNIATYLLQHDAYHFLQQTGSLLITGPTQTNVMDIMVALVP